MTTRLPNADTVEKAMVEALAEPAEGTTKQAEMVEAAHEKAMEVEALDVAADGTPKQAEKVEAAHEKAREEESSESTHACT